MSELKSLRDMGVSANPSFIGEWPHRIGQFIINFGALELFSYQYLELLEPDREHFNKNLNRPLGARISRILNLLDSLVSLSSQSKELLTDLWKEARELAVWRNRLAHNPVLPTWKPGSDSTNSPPDLMGIPDMRQLQTGNTTDSISLDGLKTLIDAASDLGRRIHAGADVIRNARA